jgi:hypothetical protein
MSENPDANETGKDRAAPSGPAAGNPAAANPTEPIQGAPSNPTLPLSKHDAGAGTGGAGPAEPGRQPFAPPQPGGQQAPYAQPYGEQGAYGAQNPYAPPQGGPAQQPYPQDYAQQPYGAHGGPGQPYYNAPGYVEQKSRLVGGLLGILLGGLGVHRFYLGYTAIGILQIVVTFLTFGFGAIWGFVEGIMILVGAEPFRRDARGIPLKE